MIKPPITFLVSHIEDIVDPSGTLDVQPFVKFSSSFYANFITFFPFV